MADFGRPDLIGDCACTCCARAACNLVSSVDAPLARVSVPDRASRLVVEGSLISLAVVLLCAVLVCSTLPLLVLFECVDVLRTLGMDLCAADELDVGRTDSMLLLRSSLVCLEAGLAVAEDTSSMRDNGRSSLERCTDALLVVLVRSLASGVAAI